MLDPALKDIIVPATSLLNNLVWPMPQSVRKVLVEAG